MEKHNTSSITIKKIAHMLLIYIITISFPVHVCDAAAKIF